MDVLHLPFLLAFLRIPGSVAALCPPSPPGSVMDQRTRPKRFGDRFRKARRCAQASDRISSHPLPLLWIEKGARIWSASPEEVGRRIASASASQVRDSRNLKVLLRISRIGAKGRQWRSPLSPGPREPVPSVPPVGKADRAPLRYGRLQGDPHCQRRSPKFGKEPFLA